MENFCCKKRLMTFGELIFNVFEGLGLVWMREKSDEISKKRKQRFVKESDLTIYEYENILNNLLDNIAEALYSTKQSQEDIKKLLNTLRDRYNSFRLNVYVGDLKYEDIHSISCCFISFFLNELAYFDLINIPKVVKGKYKSIIYNLINHIASQSASSKEFWKELKSNFKEERKDEEYEYTNKFFQNLRKKVLPREDNLKNLILALENTLQSFPELRFYKDKIRNLIYIARLIDYIFRDIELLDIKNCNTYLSKKKFFLENEEIKLLFNLLDLNREKKSEDEKIIENLILELKGKFPLIAKFFEARHKVNKNEYKEAVKLYKEVVKQGKDCLGNLVRHAVKEGLVLSAYLTKENKVNLKNSKSDFIFFLNQAYFLNLIKNTENLKKYILPEFKREFFNFFRKRYPRYIKEKEDKIFSKNLNISILEELEKIKPDFKNPNKKVYSYKHPEPQLFHFSSMGNYEVVKKLMEKGADVNYIREKDNYTALIACLENKPQENHIKIAKLLIEKMNLKTLNAKLLKKKETALSYAIRYGLTDIVQLMIDKKVNLKDKVTLDEISYRYHSILTLFFIVASLKELEVVDNIFLREHIYGQKKDIIPYIISSIKLLKPDAVFENEIIEIFKKNEHRVFELIEEFLPEFIWYTHHSSIKNAKDIYNIISKNLEDIPPEEVQIIKRLEIFLKRHL